MIDYGILVSTEHLELYRLLSNLHALGIDNKNIIVLIDSGKYNSDVLYVCLQAGVSYHFHPLNMDFATQRNYLSSLATAPYIFHVDADELLTKELVDLVNQLPNLAPHIDVFGIARANRLINDTSFDIPSDIGPPPDANGLIGWPDYQYRLMKKHIRWVNSLHEIPTSDKVGCCVADEKYAIIHTKTVSGQIKRKEFYDEIKKHKEIK